MLCRNGGNKYSTTPATQGERGGGGDIDDCWVEMEETSTRLHLRLRVSVGGGDIDDCCVEMEETSTRLHLRLRVSVGGTLTIAG